MGLMDRIKGLGNRGVRSGAGSGLAGFNDSQLVGAGAGAGGVLLHAARAEAEAYHTATMQDAQTADTSIITE